METPENISNSEIRNFLTRRLGEKEAEEIMSYINKEIDKEVIEKTQASKNEIKLWRDDMNTFFATKEDAARLEKKLIKRVSKAEGTLILWSFVFWVTLIIAMIVVFKLLR